MIPYLDLKTQYAGIKPEIDEAVANVLASAHYVLGPEVAKLEEEFAAHAGARYGIAVNTGTSALHLAMLSLGIGPGDEVITVPFTFVATVAAIRYTGAQPVLVDVTPDTLTMDPAAVEAAITPLTKAIVPVHLYGQMADMDPIMAIAKKHGLAVIEDACQAHGAEYKGRRAGSIGDLGCFSFYPGKNLGAYGEGGIVVTSDERAAERIRMMRDWGQSQRYRHVIEGFNYRMDALQGAILRVKLRHLDDWTAARRARAARYNTLLADAGVRLPFEAEDRRHVYHIYAVRSADRDALQQALSKQDIQSGLHYPIPVHLQPAHADLGYRRCEFPNSEAAAQETLSLPLYPEMTEAQVDAVANAVCEHTCVARTW
jgi:dTDP-4-amino-4,6-dideoxygalactose transaminase